MADTLHRQPDDGSTHWLTRSMAAHHGVGKDTVARILRTRNLKPWMVAIFKQAVPPILALRRSWSMSSGCMDSPESAVVLCVDEKSQCQALKRFQPSLPMTPGRAGTMTTTPPSRHDHAVRGAQRRYRRGDRRLQAAAPQPGVLGIPATDRAARVRRCGCAPRPRQLWGAQARERDPLARTPRTQRPLARPLHSHFRVVVEPRRTRVPRNHPQTATPRQLHQRHPTRRRHRDMGPTLDNNPKPFIWHRTAEEIIAKVFRGRVALTQTTESATHH